MITKRILVAGYMGVGKTTILKKSGYNFWEVDRVVKEVMYQRGHSVFKKMQETFGNKIVSGNKISTDELRSLLKSKVLDISEVNKITIPAIVEFIKSETGIFELGIFIDYKEEFENIFNFKILIDRKNRSKNKPSFLLNKRAEYSKGFDLIIKNRILKSATNSLKKSISVFI